MLLKRRGHIVNVASIMGLLDTAQMRGSATTHTSVADRSRLQCFESRVDHVQCQLAQ